MKPEEQRVAIAEACGWKKIHEIFANDGVRWATPNNKLVPVKIKLDKHQYNGWGKPESWANDYYDCWNSSYGNVPDYINDLNAIHEAENTLSEEQRLIYSEELYHTAIKCQKETGLWRYLSASAAQRAEAFLKTLNLWDNNK